MGDFVERDHMLADIKGLNGFLCQLREPAAVTGQYLQIFHCPALRNSLNRLSAIDDEGVSTVRSITAPKSLDCRREISRVIYVGFRGEESRGACDLSPVALLSVDVGVGNGELEEHTWGDQQFLSQGIDKQISTIMSRRDEFPVAFRFASAYPHLLDRDQDRIHRATLYATRVREAKSLSGTHRIRTALIYSSEYLADGVHSWSHDGQQRERQRGPFI